MSRLGSLYITSGEPDGPLSGGCCEVDEWAASEIERLRTLRAALVGLVGVDGAEELRQMEVTMRLLPAPAEDKAVSINAIHALLATLPFNAGVER